MADEKTIDSIQALKKAAADAIDAASAARPRIADLARSFEENTGIARILETARRSEHLSRSVVDKMLGQEDSAIQQMRRIAEREKVLMRAATGPLEDLRRLGMLDPTIPWRREMDLVRRAMDQRFRLPDLKEAERLIERLQSDPLSKILKRYGVEQVSVQRAMESMGTPWLGHQEKLRSITSFAELQGIGHAVGSMPAFGERLASALRIDLGDWRDQITWPSEIFTDLVARSDFYGSLGFDNDLTDFPAPAFEQSLDIAGLRRERPTLADHYGDPVPRSADDEEEQGFARTNTAHDWLVRFETQVRRFIDEQMTRAVGVDWPKRRLPNGLYEKWLDKQRIARDAGAKEWPLIAYADFTDYALVICKRDNWSQVFWQFFDRPESVRESFQRLYPVRLDTMHARPITQDDELLLYVETKRLTKVIVS